MRILSASEKRRLAYHCRAAAESYRHLTAMRPNGFEAAHEQLERHRVEAIRLAEMLEATTSEVAA